MPERTTVYDLETGAPLDTFAVDAIEIVKSDPARYAYRLPTNWAPKPTVTETAPAIVTEPPAAPPLVEPSSEAPPSQPPAPEAEGAPAPAADAAPAPSPEPPAADPAPSATDDAEKDALRAEAEALGIDVDNRWGVTTLKAKIAAVKSASADPAGA